MLQSPPQKHELTNLLKQITSGHKTTPNVALMRSDSQIDIEKTPLKDTKVQISEFNAGAETKKT